VIKDASQTQEFHRLLPERERPCFRYRTGEIWKDVDSDTRDGINKLDHEFREACLRNVIVGNEELFRNARGYCVQPARNQIKISDRGSPA